jgi:hypothetical protein
MVSSANLLIPWQSCTPTKTTRGVADAYGRVFPPSGTLTLSTGDSWGGLPASLANFRPIFTCLPVKSSIVSMAKDSHVAAVDSTNSRNCIQASKPCSTGVSIQFPINISGPSSRHMKVIIKYRPSNRTCRCEAAESISQRWPRK